MRVKDLRQRSGLRDFAHAQTAAWSLTQGHTLFCQIITANMQSETGFPSSHQLKSYVAYKSRLKLAARAVLSADAGLLVFNSLKENLAVGLCL